jgi:hypothetical protein
MAIIMTSISSDLSLHKNNLQQTVKFNKWVRDHGDRFDTTYINVQQKMLEYLLFYINVYDYVNKKVNKMYYAMCKKELRFRYELCKTNLRFDF